MPRPTQVHSNNANRWVLSNKSLSKLFLKSGRETLKSVWFLVFRTTFWLFFSLLREVFLNMFRTRGFSTVSLGNT